MADHSLIKQINERVGRLLLRHEELRRTSTLLSQQVEELTRERDSLQSRLLAARVRVDELINRLPQNTGTLRHESAQAQFPEEEEQS